MTGSNAIVRIALLQCACVLALLATAAPAQAHRVNIFAWVEGDVVHAEATFAGGKKPAMDSPVDVLDAATGIKYLETRTDRAGTLSFTVPRAASEARADLRLVLHASMGHQAEWIVQASEYLGAQAAPLPASVASGAQTAAAPSAPGSGPGIVVDDALSRLVEQAVSRAVGRAVETHVAPIKRMLAEQSQAGPTLADIVGGLGWIAGLVGVGAWMRSRRGQA